jgi:hypothetical protein
MMNTGSVAQTGNDVYGRSSVLDIVRDICFPSLSFAPCCALFFGRKSGRLSGWSSA